MIKPSETHQWATLYSNRVLLVLMYKTGQISSDEATAIGVFKDVDHFHSFVEKQMEAGLALRGKTLTVPR